MYLNNKLRDNSYFTQHQRCIILLSVERSQLVCKTNTSITVGDRDIEYYAPCNYYIYRPLSSSMIYIERYLYF